MIRRVTLSLLTLSLLLSLTASASAAPTPSKEYIFADLVFDSEVKRPSGEHFNVKGRAKFGRLSYIAPPSFMGPLLQTSADSVLGSSADRWSILTSTPGIPVPLAWSPSTCWAHLGPRR